MDAAAEEAADGDSIEAVEEDVAGGTAVATVVVVVSEAGAAAGAGVEVGIIHTTKAKRNKEARNGFVCSSLHVNPSIHPPKGKV